MKIALLADLHANREAVEAVLEHATSQGAQRHVFLGDYVGYGADPAWVVDRLRDFVERGAIAVIGNHDRAVVQGSAPHMNADARTVIDWTRKRLDADQLAFLDGLPLAQTDGARLYVHANAWSPEGWGYITGRADAVRSLQATDARITFCGHTHDPCLYYLATTGKTGDFSPVSGVPILLSAQRQWLVIPGSAGQPRDGNPAACYAIYDSDEGAITYFRVPYDHEAAGAKIRAAQLPQRLAQRLDDGQ